MNRYESSRVRHQFLAQLQKLDKDNPHIIAGVSGGPDSMAMLYCLSKEKVQTTVVHINYGLRGADSNKDQNLVEEIAGLWGFDCISLNLGELIHQTGNFQNIAREERYRIFEDLKRELNGTVIATAHHLNDQIETIFQKILRGSGMIAWKGIEALEGIYFRPLIHVSREEILRFVSELNIPYRIDRTNEESTYARNFIRNNWFPRLDELFPGWQENVLALQDRAREYELLLQEKAEEMLVDIHSIDRERLLSCDPVLQPSIIKYLCEQAFPEHTLSKRTLQQLDDLSELQTGAMRTLTSGISLMRDREMFQFIKHEQTDVYDVNSLGINDLSGSGIINIDGVGFSTASYTGEIPKGKLQADLSKISFPVTVRQWKDGDRFQPFGMKGSQLVSDHLTNRKVPSGKKKEARVIESSDGTLVAVLFPKMGKGIQQGTLSEKVRCSEETTQTLNIEIKE